MTPLSYLLYTRQWPLSHSRYNQACVVRRVSLTYNVKTLKPRHGHIRVHAVRIGRPRSGSTASLALCQRSLLQRFFSAATILHRSRDSSAARQLPLRQLCAEPGRKFESKRARSSLDVPRNRESTLDRLIYTGSQRDVNDRLAGWKSETCTSAYPSVGLSDWPTGPPARCASALQGRQDNWPACLYRSNARLKL